MPPLGSEPSSNLEGRDQELRELQTAWRDACAGRGRLVVVSGEAGIGKSTLLTGVGELATQTGVKPVWGRAWEFADAPAYFPLWPCFTTLGLSAATINDAHDAAERSAPLRTLRATAAAVGA